MIEGMDIAEHNLEKLKKIANQITDEFFQLVSTTKPITEKHQYQHEGKWPLSDQYLKVHEETVEAAKGFNRNLVGWQEEHLDMMFSMLTLFHIHDFKKEEINDAIFQCVLKFYKRGWIDLGN